MAQLLGDSFERLVRDENGSAITEYAVVIGLVVVATVAVVANFGTRVLGRWTSVNEQLDGTQSVRTPTTIR